MALFQMWNFWIELCLPSNADKVFSPVEPSVLFHVFFLKATGFGRNENFTYSGKAKHHLLFGHIFPLKELLVDREHV